MFKKILLSFLCVAIVNINYQDNKLKNNKKHLERKGNFLGFIQLLYCLLPNNAPPPTENNIITPRITHLQINAILFSELLLQNLHCKNKCGIPLLHEPQASDTEKIVKQLYLPAIYITKL